MDISHQSGAVYKIKTKLGVVNTAEASVSVLHKGETGDGFVISQPGEYEIEGISIFGYQSGEQTVYVIQVEDLRILHLGSIAQTLSDKVLTELESVDVVIVDSESLAIKELTDLLSKLEPYYVLPYGGMVDKLVPAYEHSSRSVKSLAISKTTLNEDLTEVIVFE